MKKQFLLTKTLLVALLCLVGQSVWADDEKTEVYSNDFETSGWTAKGKTDGWTCNPGNTTANTFDSKVIGVGAGTGDMGLVSPAMAYANDVTLVDVEMKFKMDACTSGKSSGIEFITSDVNINNGYVSSGTPFFSISASASGNGYWGSITVGGENYLSTLNKAALTYENNSLNRNSTGIVVLNVRFDFTSKTATFTLSEINGTKLVTSKVVSFANSAATKLDRIFIHAGKTYGGVTIDDVAVYSVKAESTVTTYSATFSESASLTPTITIYSDSERTQQVVNGTLEDGVTYYYTAALEGYQNYNGSFIVNGSNPVVNFTMTALPRYTFKVNLVNGGAVIKTLYTDEESYDGKKHDVSFSKYLVDAENKVTYSKDNTTYFTSYTSASTSPTQEVSYTPYNGVAYFFEGESFAALGTKVNNANYSGNTAGRGLNNTTNIMTIPVSGTYSLSYAICSNNVNADRTYSFYNNDSEHVVETQSCNWSVNKVLTDGTRTVADISFAENDVVKIYAQDGNIILDYVLVELKALPATLGSNGYATFASPYALDLTTANLPSGVTAYKASVSGTTVTFTTLNQTVPANTGVLLKGTGTVNIPVAATGTAVEGNDFLVNEGGTTFAGDASCYYFGLVKNSNPLTFRKFDPSAIAIPADKAYLKVLKGSVDASRGLEFVFDDEVTGVNEVRSQKEDVRSEWFDLQGRKVAQPQKGLYIVNGRKVVVK